MLFSATPPQVPSRKFYVVADIPMYTPPDKVPLKSKTPHASLPGVLVNTRGVSHFWSTSFGKWGEEPARRLSAMQESSEFLGASVGRRQSHMSGMWQDWQFWRWAPKVPKVPIPRQSRKRGTPPSPGTLLGALPGAFQGVSRGVPPLGGVWKGSEMVKTGG